MGLPRSSCGILDQGPLKLFVEYDTARLATSANLEDFSSNSEACRGAAGKKRVFFDEAARFKADASDLLLKLLEEHANDLVLCFATTEPELIATSASVSAHAALR